MSLRASSFPLAISFLALLLTSAAPARAQNPPERPKQVSPQEEAEAMETTELPEYPDTAEGLENLINEMLRLERSGDQKTLAVYAKSLELPDGDAWFSRTFDADAGHQFAEQTAPMRNNTEHEAVNMIGTMQREGLVNVKAVKFTAACSNDATAEEYPLLLLRQSQAPFYDVRFRDSSRQTIWGFFVYVDGSFRYVAMPQLMRLTEGGGSSASGRVKVDPDAQAAKLIHKVPPDYSKFKDSRNAASNVILQALIGKDGSVRDVRLLEGVCGPSEAVMNAARQWCYSPTLVNGEPVEVYTTITVVSDPGNQ
jgi:Gram-negative bacterial TonB protein C-terminal